MKNIIFTIQTNYSEENYFLTANENENIEIQIFNAMANICFCDDYKIIGYKEVNQEYATERNEAIAEYEKLFSELVEDNFCSGQYVTLESIQEDIKWRLNECLSCSNDEDYTNL